MPRNRYRIAFHVLALGVLGAAQARAGFSVQFDSTDASGTHNTEFNYTASITSSDSIVAGDYFKITDFSGLVYHASYVRWCERGRSDFLRLLGNDHRGLIDGSTGREPAAFVVRRMALEYLKPARIDEILEVTTSVAEIGAAHLVLDQRIARSGTALFEAKVTVVLVSVSGKPMRLASTVRAAFVGAKPAEA